jgi:cell wall-associated NlpC family hydrolase
MAANSSRRNRRRPCPHCRRRQRRLLTGALVIVTTFTSLATWAIVSFGSSSPAQAADMIVHKPKSQATAAQVPSYSQQEIRKLLSDEFAQPAQPTITHTAATHKSSTPRYTPRPSGSPTYTAPAAPTPTPTVTYTYAPPPTNGSLASRLLAEAETQQGVPYVYGGASPGGFDCSGLVYWSALQIGISNMPRDTYSMLGQGTSSGLLVPTSNPQPGDLAFFGSGHVELYVKPGETFGAQQPGTSVGFHSYGGSWSPTAFYAIS